jgi:hypothetical protein
VGGFLQQVGAGMQRQKQIFARKISNFRTLAGDSSEFRTAMLVDWGERKNATSGRRME